MDSILPTEPLALSRLHTPSPATTTTIAAPSSFRNQLPCLLLYHPGRKSLAAVFTSTSQLFHTSDVNLGLCRLSPVSVSATLLSNSVPPRNGAYVVGDFMTRKEDLHVVKTTTTVDEALEALVENRITGFPVIDDDWKLGGLVSDYDLLALDSISGGGRTENSMFPEVDSTWKTFNEVQKLLSKSVKPTGKLLVIS